MARHFKKAFADAAHVVLIDETGLLLNPLVRRTWAPRGKTPVLESWGGHRKKVSVIGAVTHEARAVIGSATHNSAVLLDRAGNILGESHKIQMVPFGEYLPFGERFPQLYTLIPAVSGR